MKSCYGKSSSVQGCWRARTSGLVLSNAWSSTWNSHPCRVPALTGGHMEDSPSRRRKSYQRFFAWTFVISAMLLCAQPSSATPSSGPMTAPMVSIARWKPKARPASARSQPGSRWHREAALAGPCQTMKPPGPATTAAGPPPARSAPVREASDRSPPAPATCGARACRRYSLRSSW